MIPRPSAFRTQGDVRKLVNKAKTAAAVLRSAGHRFAGPGERKAIADMLDDLSDIARHRLNPEHEPTPDQHVGGDDVITDLCDGRAS